jgi:ribonuclease BN (tRNA processing enzyme)
MLKRARIALLVIALMALPGAIYPHGFESENRYENSKTQIVILGTGNPNADPDRSGPSLAIVVNDTPYLIDFGPGVVRRAAAAARKGIKALEAKKLRVAFATHLHTDHTMGLPDLIFTPWVLERESPLELFGPPGIKRMADHILEAYREDIRIRIDGLEPANETGYRVNVHEIKPGVVYKDQNVTVKAFAVPHGSWKHAFGYRFETADRTVVISGDTGPSPAIAEICNGCDVLIHEVYSTEKFATRPPVWKKYHSSFHTSTKELAEIATKARPKLLILYHQLYWGASDEDLLRETEQAYKGRVVSARDLDIY